jgi:ubiquinol-cytochrome c reductase cytochrome c1 subunit
MTVAMRTKEAKEWFGAPPPDLSVITRSRGADWVYTYLRSFYRDDTRPTGWNNTVFDKVGMPHVLHELQGQSAPVMRAEHGEDGKTHEVVDHLQLAKPGKMTQAEYDALVADLVNYLTWMGEPAKAKRMQTGVFVLLFLAAFFVVAFYLKKDYWKDVH